MLKGKHIVIGITAGIAAYKIPFLIRLLVKEGAEVRVIMTPAAQNFVTPLTLSTITRNPVITEPFDRESGSWHSHVDLGRWADLMLFAPVTANTLGKMAHGIADNFLVTAYLSAKCPVFLAPSMDLDMFQHPSTRKNLDTLKSYGHTIIDPPVGELASGLTGPGRMEEPENLFSFIRDFFFQSEKLTGKNILVTAGPTFEPIDPVRFIGNHSSGLMGFSIAEEAAVQGAQVTLITGPVHLSVSHSGITRIDVQTANEMLLACEQHVDSADVLIMTAAVADFTVNNPSVNKLNRTSGNLDLALTPTADILKILSVRKRPDQCFVGFALESDEGLNNARKKLLEKGLDIIVLNSLVDPGAGFGVPTNTVTILTKTGDEFRGECKPKQQVAVDILSHLVDYLTKTQNE